MLGNWRFNPRTRRACDNLSCVSSVFPILVSIHARVERATRPVRTAFELRKVSIHARVARATGAQLTSAKRITVSIHARVERATFSKVSGSGSGSGFNPRTRRACDFDKP